MKIAMSDLENSHERPFSIISKANTYGFLTKKWSPPEIQECDLWQGNICGVRCMSLLGSCFGAPKVLHEEAASAEVVPRRWPKVPFHGASALQTDIEIE